MKLLIALSIFLGLAGPVIADVLSEDFNGGTFPPTGWTVVDNTGNGGWLLNTDYGRSNYTGGDGDAAAIDSDTIGWGEIDTELITPSFVVPAGSTLEFNHSFRWYSGGLNEQADVDVSVNGGPWILLENYSGGDDGYPTGVHKSIDLSSYAGNNAQIRFRYYDSNWDWWWQVDDVVVTGTAALDADTYAIPASAGGIVDFALTAGIANANRNYFLLGSVTGTKPGFPLPGGLVILPLNWDIFTGLVFKLANTPPLANFYGTLYISGNGTGQLNTFGPLPPTSVGIKMYFAYLLYYPFDFVSNPVEIEIVP